MFSAPLLLLSVEGKMIKKRGRVFFLLPPFVPSLLSVPIPLFVFIGLDQIKVGSHTTLTK